MGRLWSLFGRLGAQPGSPRDRDPAAGAELAHIEFQIPDMVCEGCAENVDGVLRELAGVRGVRPNVPEKRVRVSFETERVNVQQLRNALTMAGYSALDVDRRQQSRSQHTA